MSDGAAMNEHTNETAVVREAMAQAWDEGSRTTPGYWNPYSTPPEGEL